MTPLITGVKFYSKNITESIKSYSLLKIEEIASIVYGVIYIYIYIYIYITEEITPSVTGPGVKSYST